MHLAKKMTVTEVTSIRSFIRFSWVAEQEERLSSSLFHSPSSYLLALGIHPPPHLQYLTVVSRS